MDASTALVRISNHSRTPGQALRRATWALNHRAALAAAAERTAHHLWLEALEPRRLLSAEFGPTAYLESDLLYGPGANFAAPGGGWYHLDEDWQATFANAWRVTLTKFNADGSPDPSFGTGGSVAVPVPLEPGHNVIWQQPLGLIVQRDGKLVLTGNATQYDVEQTGGVALIALACGTADPGPTDAPDASTVDASTADTSASDFNMLFFERLNADGTPDAAFGRAGTAWLPAASSAPYADPDRTWALDDGRIEAIEATADGVVIYRLRADGTPDDALGPGGVLDVPLSPDAGLNFAPYSEVDIAGRADGSATLYLSESDLGAWSDAGYPDDGTDLPHGDDLVRVDLDPAGHVTSRHRFPPSLDRLSFNVRAADDGSAFVFSGWGADNNNVLRRVRPDGTFDPSFHESADAAALGPLDTVVPLSSGRVLVTFLTDQAQSALAVRLNANGSIDPTFNGGSPVKIHGLIDTATETSDGSLLLSGFDLGVRTAARLLPDGTVASETTSGPPDDSSGDGGIVEPITDPIYITRDPGTLTWGTPVGYREDGSPGDAGAPTSPFMPTSPAFDDNGTADNGDPTTPGFFDPHANATVFNPDGDQAVWAVA